MLCDQPYGNLYRSRFGFRFATQRRWIDGYLTSAHRRLLDVLNSHCGDSLLCEQISVLDLRGSSINQGVAACGHINTSAVLFAVPIEQPEDRKPGHDPTFLVNKCPTAVRLGMGPYEILGHMHLIQNARLDDVISSITDNFVAVTDVAVTRLDDSSFNEDCPVIFVNRQKIDYIVAAT